MSVAGVVLAAGEGRRMGAPKALVRDASGPTWVVTAARALADGGCEPVFVVVGAHADAVRAQLRTEPVRIVAAPDWADGMGASLRAGLTAAATTDAVAAMVHLVDIPDVGPEVVRRLLARAAPDVLARAGYGPQRHGHPVLIGRAHWGRITAEAGGDTGARAYFARHEVDTVDCGDLAGGADIDRADDLPAGARLPKLAP